MGSYSYFYILSIFYCISYLFFMVCYLLKINLRVPIVFLCILGIYVHTMSHAGGPDYLIYSLFYESILDKQWSEIFDLLGTELWLLPFFTIFRWLNLDFRWALFFSALLLYLILKLCSLLSKNNYSYFFSWCFATLLASPMAPYLFGNVIRQGLASIVVLYFMAAYLKGNIGGGLGFIPAFLLTHRAAIIFSFITFYLSTSWLYKSLFVASFLLAIFLFVFYWGDSFSMIYSFYRSFDEAGVFGETSIIRSILRLCLIFLPLLVWVLLTKNLEKVSWEFIALFIMVMFSLYIVAAKLGDRFMYFTPALIYPVIFSSKTRVVIAVSTLFIVFPTLGLIITGYYESLFL